MRESLRTIERTCGMCRSKGDKRTLARMVCVSGSLVWDEAQRLPGRGGYVHLSPQCVSKMGQPARWERILNLKPRTLAVEQVRVVAQALLGRINAQVSAGGRAESLPIGVGSNDKAVTKKVRL